jgi:hypothetical protein
VGLRRWGLIKKVGKKIGRAVLATKLCWLFLMKGWTLSRPIDVGLGSIDNGFTALPNKVRPNKNLANSWVKLGLYLEEGPGDTGIDDKEYRMGKSRESWLAISRVSDRGRWDDQIPPGLSFLALSDRVRPNKNLLALGLS